MNHKDIIQLFLYTSKSRNYLEIGVGKGKTFAAVKADYKAGDEFFAEENRPAVEFDVIFINSVHEYQQAYSDIIKALPLLAPDGVIIVKNCKPLNEVVGLPPEEYALVSKKIRKENKGAWTGDTWKSIVRLQSFHHDLHIFTIDAAYGCAVIAKGTPESALYFSEEEIKTMTFGDLRADFAGLLNLKSPDYLYTFIMDRRGPEMNLPKLYMENPADELLKCVTPRYYPGSPDVQILKKGIILPLKRDEKKSIDVWQGGVCDSERNFAAGHLSGAVRNPPSKYTITSSYKVKRNELTVLDETVIYAGIVVSQFGHMIVDGMSRWWYLARHYRNEKVALVLLGGGTLRPIYLQLLSWLGIPKERVIIIDKPTQFQKVLVPDQALFRGDRYRDYFLDTFYKIRSAIKPAGYDKIYLTRRFLDDNDTINEEYFERFFENRGYKVVAPEKLPLYEQISIISGAKEIACVQGTLSHLIVFTRNGVRLTVLARTQEVQRVQIGINQMCNPCVTFIDVSMNFLPTTHANGAFLLMPTPQWKQYLRDHHAGLPEISLDLWAGGGGYVAEYIKLWVRTFNSPMFKRIKDKTAVDFLAYLSKYILDKPIDRNYFKSIYAEDAQRVEQMNQIREYKNQLKLKENDYEQ